MMTISRYLIFFSFVSMGAVAQELNVKADIDSSSILIGEQVRLKLTAFFSSPAEKKIEWPVLKDTITGKVEVVSKSKIDTQQTESGTILYTQELLITSFDSGYHPIPPFLFKVSGDTSQVFETEALLLEVQTVPVDTTQDIRDIKGPVDIPFHWTEAIPYAIGVAILIGLITGIIFYFKYRKKKEPVQKNIPVKAPHETALEQLDILRNEKLWQQGRTKEYYIRLSDIFRIYVEQRFRIPALELTSDELLSALRNFVDQEQRAKARQLLLLSDLVKFAKENPIAHENELTLNNAVEFINETRPIVQPVKEEER